MCVCVCVSTSDSKVNTKKLWFEKKKQNFCVIKCVSAWLYVFPFVALSVQDEMYFRKWSLPGRFSQL